MTKKSDEKSDAPEAAPAVAEPDPGVLTEAEATAIAYRYVGNGEAIAGIPPRDLTALDIENLDLALRREVYVGRFYQAV